MRNTIKKILFPFLQFWYKRKNAKTTSYKNHGVDLLILPHVFHPGIFLSTNIFIEFIKTLQIKDKKVLELGAGSGLISFYSAKNGAIVTATDININAIKGLEENAQRNRLEITIVQSDLFDELQPVSFDYIFINPPYYPKTPMNEQEHAFYCGENFEYFKKLFKQLRQNYCNRTNMYMILSEDCDIEGIKKLAKVHQLNLNLNYETSKLQERNYIFKVENDE